MNKPKGCNYKLFAQVPREDQESFSNQFRNSEVLRREFIRHFTQEYWRLIRASENTDQHGSPAWTSLQSDNIGQRRAYRDIVESLGGNITTGEIDGTNS